MEGFASGRGGGVRSTVDPLNYGIVLKAQSEAVSDLRSIP